MTKWLTSFTILMFAVFLATCTNSQGQVPNSNQESMNRELSRLQQVTREIAKRREQDQVAGRDPEKRAVLVAQLMATVSDSNLLTHSPASVEEAIGRLARLKAQEAIPIIVQHLEFHTVLPYEFGSPENVYPAVYVLEQIGQPSLPTLLDVLTTPTNSALSQENAWYAILHIERPKNNIEMVGFLYKHAVLLDQRIKRLKLLAEQVKTQFKDVQYNNPRPTDAAVDSVERREHVYRLISALTYSQTVETDKRDLSSDIRELGSLQAPEAIPILAELLDVPQPVSDKTQTVTYPAINALVALGKPAVPAIANSMIEDLRSKLFRENGLEALVRILGSADAASKSLEDMAQVNTEKAQSLRHRAELLQKKNGA